MAAAYDNYDYPEFWEARNYEHNCEVIALKHFFKKIKSKPEVLEIGSGYGRLAKVYNKYAKNITLVDPSHSLLSRARKIFKPNSADVKYIRSTVQNLPKKLKKKDYGVVLMVRVMHHIKDPNEAFDVVSQYVPKGSYFILEFANKLHGKALVKNIIKGNFTFPLDIFPQDKRSKKNKKKGTILFLNHHPDVVLKSLKDHNFKIIEKRSVSNVRTRWVKENISMPMLLSCEEMMQKPLAKVNFGPSIFVLAKKT